MVHALPPPARRLRIIRLGDKAKIIAMGLMLGLVGFLYFLPHRRPVNPTSPRVERAVVEVKQFQPDPRILKKVTDATPSDRSVTEPEAMQHLLKLALNMTPDIAAALRMPEHAIPVDSLRQNPQSYRGRYLWYKGKLEYFQEVKTRHPVQGYKIYQGYLRTTAANPEEEEVVFFYVSKPPEEEIGVGDFARIQGYLMKLRDEHLLVKTDKPSPLLIGKMLKPAYPDWKAVDKVDLSILRRAKNATWRNGRWINDEEAWLSLQESESTPLWHLASLARHQLQQLEPQQTSIPYLLTKNQIDEFKFGARDQGTPVRIKGRFAWSRIFKADTNPAGIDSWSEVWIQLPRLGGMSVPIWIAKDIAEGDKKWRRLQDVELVGYYFKNHHYQTVTDEKRFTPLFVAAGLEAVELPVNPLRSTLGYLFMGAIVLLIWTIFMMFRTNLKETAKHEEELVGRRRRRRGRLLQASEQG